RDIVLAISRLRCLLLPSCCGPPLRSRCYRLCGLKQPNSSLPIVPRPRHLLAEHIGRSHSQSIILSISISDENATSDGDAAPTSSV
ncbi:hypothetical protein OH77DRAFT_1509197, partial [Trametes cingulata]